MDHCQAILYPIPLVTRQLPSHVCCRSFLSPLECTQLTALATQKGYRHFTQSRYGEIGTVQVETCEVTPDEAEFVYARVAASAAGLNHANWQLALTGIVDTFRVLRYRDGY